MFKQFISRATFISLFLCLCNVYAADYFTYEVRAYDISPPVTLSGTVIPKTEVTFKAQSPGEVIQIAGEEGDWFREKTVLVALDDKALLAKRDAAIAQWYQANTTLRDAGMQYFQQKHSPDSLDKAPGGMGIPYLFDQIFTKPISDLFGRSDDVLDRRAQLHSYGSRIEQARSALWQAKSQIDQIEVKLRDTGSQAPFDGVIIEKFVEVGDTVMMGQPLLQFADIGHLQIEVDVSARLVRGLKVGKQVSAKLDVLDEHVIVTVAQIFPIADKQRHTVKVKFDLSVDTESEDGQYVGPGQYAQVDVPDVQAGEQKLLLVPETAVVRRGSLPAICVFKNNKHERHLVRLGKTIPASRVSGLETHLGDFVSVISGLREGDIVVVNKVSGKTPC
ncbi:MAG: efflux RND transporter periplasmic adaptor subunit [Candidatus Parabeggiatoa sp. nov. 1]|nr:MAG: efflux RND transporter periplasmic adaptor subunit [Gammaproteobacteria bacterium]